LINPSRVFSDIFNDKNVIEKLAITALVFLLSAFTSVFFIGLVGWAALVGYQLDIVRHVRDGVGTPLPRWTDFTAKINAGASVFVATMIYNLPNMLLSCFVAAIFNMDNGLFGVMSVCCCALPVMLAINLFTVPAQAVGTVRYAETGRIGSFFNVTELLDIIRANTSLIFQWWLWATLANAVIGVLGIAIPCIGWLATSCLLIPVQGHLLGQLAARLAEEKRKNL
jgi:hypothetical protein